MKRLVFSVLLGFLIAGLPMSGVTASTSKFPSCAALLKQFPSGVARDIKSAKEAVANGMRRPKANKSVYESNQRNLDRDKDGVACEQGD